MQFLMRSIAILIKILCYLAMPFLHLYFFRRRRVSPVKNPLLLLSATDLIERMKRRQVKSEEIVKAMVERMREVNPLINAIFEERFESAIIEAQKVDQLIDGTEDLEELFKSQPLLGIPLTVKEVFGVQGMSQTAGIKMFANRIAEEETLCIRYLRDAGAIVLCVSNVPELGMGIETSNGIIGLTSNPFDTSRSVAGTSGGEAALLGSGASLLGIGSDMAGSARIPAMFCGVFGHKVTPGVVITDKWFPVLFDDRFKFYHSAAPMVRYAKDFPLIIETLSGPKASQLRLQDPVNLKDLRVFYCCGVWEPLAIMSNEIKNQIKMAAAHFEALGCEVEQLDIPGMYCMNEICGTKLLYMDGVPEFLEESMNSQNLVVEWMKIWFGKSNWTYEGLTFITLLKNKGCISKKSIEKYDKLCHNIERQLLEKLNETGVLLFPTFPSAAFMHYLSPAVSAGIAYSAIFNILGFPATHIPCGFDKSKRLPIGFQVVSAPYQDRLCLAVARELEQVFGGWQSVPE